MASPEETRCGGQPLRPQGRRSARLRAARCGNQEPGEEHPRQAGEECLAQVGVSDRFKAIGATYRAIARYDCQDSDRPYALFGAAINGGYSDREERAYEEVLHKFDEMLTRQGHASGIHERGIVIHDTRRLVERDVQAWTQSWREVAGRIGKLTHIADVPLFADSRASRLIQAADFVSWGLFRYYGPAQSDKWIKDLWSRFDAVDGVMHGLIHVHPQFRAGRCTCPACSSRAS